MIDTRGRGLIRFSPGDLELFSAASHDRNPLHLSEIYARKTPYGDRVVFGVLGGLACLGRLKDRSSFFLSSIVLEFQCPMFASTDYVIEAIDVPPDRATAKIYDGKRVLLKAIATFRKGALPFPSDGIECAPRAEPIDLESSDLVQGLAVQGIYSPSRDRLRAVVERVGLAGRIGTIQIVALMWCSYLVGMELPGRRALLSKLSIHFEGDWRGSDSQLAYKAEVVAFDKRFDLLKIGARLFSGGMLLANAELWSFVRQEAPAVTNASIESLLPRSEMLKGKVALVIGASRGLGATIARSLALQGCTVLVNFLKSRAEAERLKESSCGVPGEVVLFQGDGSDLYWCKEVKHKIAHEYGRLDFLICNACPVLRPLWLDPSAADRINEYVTKSLALVGVPMTVFLDALSENSGWNIVISSIAVHRTPLAEWPHYVSAKCAIEGLTKVAALEYGAVSFLIVRPPRLLTDLTNTPLGRQVAISPEKVAAKITKRLGGPAAPGCVEILEEFS